MTRTLALLLAAAPLPAAAQDAIRSEADGSRTLVNEALVPASPDALWPILTTPAGWQSWGATRAWATDDPDVIETSYAPDAKPGDVRNIRHRFVTRMPGRQLVFRTIQTPQGFPHPKEFMAVTQTLELIPEAGGTRVRLTGRNYAAGPAGDTLLGFFEKGNRETLDRLVQRAASEPIEFLVGHCWRGNLPNGAEDTHCFRRGDDGVHDTHTVLAGGKKVYWGDTLYAWDGNARALRLTYTAMSGGTMTALVRQIPDGLDFGTSDFVSTDGKRLPITTHWLRIGANAYDAHDDSQAGKPRVTRYTRVD